MELRYASREHAEMSVVVKRLDTKDYLDPCCVYIYISLQQGDQLCPFLS